MRRGKFAGDGFNQRMVLRGKKRASVRSDVYPLMKILRYTSASASNEPNFHGVREFDPQLDSQYRDDRGAKEPVWLVVLD